MQIISKFKDYYDCMQKFASYEDSPYNRSLSTIPFKRKTCLDCSNYQIPFIIGFCGALYGGMKLLPGKVWNFKLKKYELNKKDIIYLYSYDDYLKTKLERPNKDVREERRELESIFFTKNDDSLFIEYSSPSFILTEGSGFFHTINKVAISNQSALKGYYNENGQRYFVWPTLSLYQFNQIIPTEQAYMSIESYIRGTLSREYKNEPKEENNVKIERAGFDLKSSFRRN